MAIVTAYGIQIGAWKEEQAGEGAGTSDTIASKATKGGGGTSKEDAVELSDSELEAAELEAALKASMQPEKPDEEIVQWEDTPADEAGGSNNKRIRHG